LLGSPWPRLQRKLDFTRPSGKNSASTLALSNPDIPPTSRPTARAASMKYAPCSVALRNAVISASVGFFAKASAISGRWAKSFFGIHSKKRVS
jgi:hypothetical protein